MEIRSETIKYSKAKREKLNNRENLLQQEIEAVIQQTQEKLFSFLWKHKKDKIKRQVLFQPLSKGGLNFPRFRTVVKALRLSWIFSDTLIFWY